MNEKFVWAIEEISATLKETASIALLNAENSRLALKLFKDALIMQDGAQKAESLQNVGKLLSEISIASEELANGTKQISTVMSQIEADASKMA